MMVCGSQIPDGLRLAYMKLAVLRA
jgi:hypothetical protein